MDNQKHRKPTTSKLKRILQCKSNVSPLPSLDKDFGHTIDKTPPFLQHSNNIHSLSSPSRSSFEIEHRSTAKTSLNSMHQPLSAPPSSFNRQKTKQSHFSSSTSSNTRSTLTCTTKKSHSSTTATNPIASTGSATTGRRSSSLHYNSRPRWNQTGIATSTITTPPLPSKSLKKTHTDGSIALQDKNTTNTNIEKTTTTPAASTAAAAATKRDNNKGRRRHSCSSTTQDQQRHQRTRMVQEAKKTPLGTPNAKRNNKASPSPFHAITPSCSVLFSKASPAANAALAVSSSPSPLISKQQQQQPSYRRQCPPPVLSLEKSRSTPLRPLTKIKTYNVSTANPPTPQRSTSSSLTSPNKRRSQRHDGTMFRTEHDSERKRRQQELEDLISGRRGSTLKLSLTPKNTLLN